MPDIGEYVVLCVDGEEYVSDTAKDEATARRKAAETEEWARTHGWLGHVKIRTPRGTYIEGPFLADAPPADDKKDVGKGGYEFL
ncbi:MAG: hypothetical protein RLZZ324_1314 [Candidatus Parcubacteria bacterium]|jgi:hypothetical protein